jgi:hypothetical protein
LAWGITGVSVFVGYFQPTTAPAPNQNKTLEPRFPFLHTREEFYSSVWWVMEKVAVLKTKPERETLSLFRQLDKPV